MPELPEVETVRRGLAPAMDGARFAAVEQRRADLRFPFPKRFRERLVGHTITTFHRRAKYLVAGLSSGEALIMHLGMSGRFSVIQPGEAHPELQAHDHVIFTMSNDFAVIYNDPRRFGFMDIVDDGSGDTCRHLSGLGIEPLGNQLSGPEVMRLLAGKKTPLKSALLDQRLIAGLGNIYVCEALFRAGLHPTRQSGSLRKDEADTLATCIRDVLNEAIESGGSTLKDYAKTDGTLGYFQHAFRVYDREDAACVTPRCRGHVARIVQAGRSTFFCPQCQPEND